MKSIDWNLTLTISGWLIGLVSVLVSIYYGKKSGRLERERITLNWEDVQLAADDIAKRIETLAFEPDIIFTFGSRGAYIAHLLSDGMKKNAPVLVGLTFYKGIGVDQHLDKIFSFFETSRWKVGVPTQILGVKDRKILIVFDWVLSGDSLQKIRDALVSNGTPFENIKSVAIIATEICVQNEKGPDIYWKLTNSSNFFFPWGRAL